MARASVRRDELGGLQRGGRGERTSGIQDRIDQQLAPRGLRREWVLEMPSYLMLPPLLESGDELAVIPGQLADAFCRHGRLVALRPPLALPPSTIRMHWHRRFHEDVANVWLRGVIAAEFGDGGGATAQQKR